MLETPMDVLLCFPVRKTKTQKTAFLDGVQPYIRDLGYSCAVETGTFGCRNLVIGDPENAKYLVTAHYDTCARMLIPNLVTPCSFWIYVAYQLLIVGIMMAAAVFCGVAAGVLTQDGDMVGVIGAVSYWIFLAMLLIGPANPSCANDNTSGVVTLLEILRTMPKNQRSKVCFVLFDLEETGMIGSTFYRKAHRAATDGQLVLNLDCVGEGDNILLIPVSKLKKDRKKLTSLYRACGYFGKKSIVVQETGFCFYPSDQTRFPWGVGIGAFHKSRLGIHYYGRIHTPRDTVLDITNINILRAALTTYICCDEVN